MKAVVWTKYGPPDVLQQNEVEKPIPKDNEVLIRIHAATVTMGDCEIRSLNLPLMFSLPMRFYFGFRKPKRVTILGMEFAGVIESVGKDVFKFRKGDEVFGSPEMSLGTYAEYKCLPENGIFTKKPENATFEEAAAAIIGGCEALHFLSEANIKKGQNVLINGAGGSIGTAALQYARSLGTLVTAVDSTGKLDMLRSIGADKVVDYTKEDFTKIGETFDVIFDVVGKGSYSRSIRSLKKDGYLLIGNPRIRHIFQKLWTSIFSRKKVVIGTTEYTTELLDALRDQIEAGNIRSVIDKRYTLDQTAHAHRYVETGQKKGNVVINIIDEERD